MATTSPSGGTTPNTPAKTKPPVKTAAKTASKAPAKPAAGDYTAQTWAVALLSRLGAPASAQNIQAVVSWEAAEGGHWNNTAYYNPLNTTQDAAGATSMNSVGVKAYTSWQEGLDATVKTLENGNYGSVLTALRQGNNAQNVANAVVQSPWGTQQIALGGNDVVASYGTSKVDTSNRTIANDSLHTPPDQTVSDYLGNPDIAASYGYLAAYMKDPEIGPILAKAAQKGWNSGELLSALQKTHWWQTMSDTKRHMQASQREDSASYKQQVANKTAQVSALAASMGLNIGGKQLQQIATTSLWSNWSDLQLQEAVGSEFKYQPGKAVTGTAGADIQQFKAMADAYMVPLSNQTLDQWTRSALEGKINPKDYTGYLAQQAKTLFPWMSHAIDSGIDPNTYLDPYRQAAAKTLELDPNQINFMDPKWMSLFQAVDPKTGQRSELGLANAMTKMRTDPRYGYDRTQGARQDAASFAASLAHQFGFTGTDSAFSGVSQQGL